jgi:hypothetical protein
MTVRFPAVEPYDSGMLVTHYWRHAAFLQNGQILRNAATLKASPRHTRPRSLRRQQPSRNRLAPVPKLVH